MTTDEFIKLLAVVYVFLGGVLTAVFAFSQVRNSNNAKAINDLSNTVIELNKEIDRIKTEKDLEIAQLKARVLELERELEHRPRNKTRSD